MRWLEAVAPTFIAAAMLGYVAPAEPSSKVAASTVVKNMDDTDGVDWDVDTFIDEVEPGIAAAHVAGSKAAAEMIGVDLTNPSEPAIEFAKRRAAELIGMKRGPSGAWMPNPNARWAINETIREQARGMLEHAVKEGLSWQDLSANLQSIFSEARADMIARTEGSLTYNAATLAVYRENGQELVAVLDGIGCLPVGHDDEAPLPDGEVGVIDYEAQANGQIWNIDEIADELRISHPHCVRAFIAYEAPIDEEAA